MKKILHHVLLTGMILAAPVTLLASEGQTPPPQQKATDPAKFELGQKVFTGKVKLPEADAKLAEKQSPKLKELQAKLPKESQEKTKLPSLAGRLTEKQLDALAHFVEKRYCAK